MGIAAAMLISAIFARRGIRQRITVPYSAEDRLSCVTVFTALVIMVLQRDRNRGLIRNDGIMSQTAELNDQPADRPGCFLVSM